MRGKRNYLLILGFIVVSMIFLVLISCGGTIRKLAGDEQDLLPNPDNAENWRYEPKSVQSNEEVTLSVLIPVKQPNSGVTADWSFSDPTQGVWATTVSQSSGQAADDPADADQADASAATSRLARAVATKNMSLFQVTIVPANYTGSAGEFEATLTLTAGGEYGAEQAEYVLHIEVQPSDQLLHIHGITPTVVRSGVPTYFSSDVENPGDLDLVYAWSFGSAGDPDSVLCNSGTTDREFTPINPTDDILTVECGVTVWDSDHPDNSVTQKFDLLILPNAIVSPTISGVSPIVITEGEEAHFNVHIVDEDTTQYMQLWEFGAACSPDSLLVPPGAAEDDDSRAATPINGTDSAVTYDCSVTVWEQANPSNQGKHEFKLIVLPPAPAATGEFYLHDVTPLSGTHGSPGTFSVGLERTIDTTSPVSYVWSFGGGAQPEAATTNSPAVTFVNTADETKTCECSVTAWERDGLFRTDTLEFQIEVAPESTT